MGGTWFFTKKDSVKFGYQRGWMDRTNREVAETIEGSFYGALDMQLRKNLSLRVAGRHHNRTPQGGVSAYELDTGNVYARMPDQATRVLSSWGAPTQPKAWNTTGTYRVRARARCVTHPEIVSNWSSALPVTIVDYGYRWL